jgi:hypothetical protein
LLGILSIILRRDLQAILLPQGNKGHAMAPSVSPSEEFDITEPTYSMNAQQRQVRDRALP